MQSGGCRLMVELGIFANPLMHRDIDLQIPLTHLNNEAQLHQTVAQASGMGNAMKGFCILRRSVDARGRAIKFNLRVRVFDYDAPPLNPNYIERYYKNVASAPEVHIIGTGPGGLFAALRLIELGLKPIVFERGKPVRERRRDLAQLTRNHLVNPNSNYCFGEGGAGTYSDGKLYTRSSKRGDIYRILSTLVHHGADPDILVDAHPHIGTNRLPGIITAIREQIEQCGGSVHFDSRLTDIEWNELGVTHITINNSTRIATRALILATGHSARDVYELLHHRKITLEQKPFAMGVRAEHQQTLIDQRQYHCDTRPDGLQAASYALVEQVDGRGVYSFCMCPGGIIAPCATAPGEVVTNGWSPSKRNNPFANSGIVVTVENSDTAAFAKQGPLAGMYFQKAVEQACCQAAGGTQAAPAQRLTDLVNKKTSSTLPACSYTPGLVSIELGEVLPAPIINRLRVGFRAFDQKMNGYLTHDAVAVAVESRTSSPVRIPRSENMQHPQVRGLFPCGEGGGYAGGIVSAAMDGERVAEAVAKISFV